ncbi:hypothetical protein E2C01_088072 [Portunus trituberculatus]|uniref:Uncharacterized protein n=1 Tax=Portunus trituberculatus TaxID=210409 RepID=A0A5B7JI74_PORTR|nr:hypothetical protein [Portunus trituberculatus]
MKRWKEQSEGDSAVGRGKGGERDWVGRWMGGDILVATLRTPLPPYQARMSLSDRLFPPLPSSLFLSPLLWHSPHLRPPVESGGGGSDRQRHSSP